MSDPDVHRDFAALNVGLRWGKKNDWEGEKLGVCVLSRGEAWEF